MGKLMDAFLGGRTARTAMDENAYLQDQYKKLTEGALLQAPQQPPNPPAYPTHPDRFAMHPIGMISMRMRIPNGERFPLPHIDAYVTKDVAVVFTIDKSNRPVIIEDDPGLFPSDTLITQLRLLIG